jgi:hypothetical protein
MFSAFPLKADIAGFQAQTEKDYLAVILPDAWGERTLVPLFREGEGSWKIAQGP